MLRPLEKKRIILIAKGKVLYMELYRITINGSVARLKMPVQSYE